MNGFPVTREDTFYYYPDWPEDSEVGRRYPFNVDGYSYRN